MWAPGMELQHPRLTLRQQWRTWDAKLPDSNIQAQFLKQELQMRQSMSKLRGKRRGRETTKGGHEQTQWRNQGSTSKAGKQLHYPPPGITNLESTPETMQWSNAYKNACTWNKPLEGSIPIGRYHGFSIPYPDCHRHLSNTCYVHIVYIGFNLTSSPLNYLLINFSVYLPFLHCFFPYDSLLIFAKCWWEVKARQGLVLMEWPLWTVFAKCIHQFFLTAPPHAWQNQDLYSTHAPEVQELLRHLVK